MGKGLKITLDHLEQTYPGFRPVGVHEFKRKNQLIWSTKIGHIGFWNYGNMHNQIKAVITAGAVKVCVMLRNPDTEEVLLPDIDTDKFIKNN